MQHRAETGAQAAGLNPRSLLNHSPGRKTGFSTPLPNLALAHFSNFSLAVLTLLPLPGGLSLPSSGRPFQFHDSLPFSKPQEHEGLSRSEARWHPGTVGRFPDTPHPATS